jgi:hypothetical protein
VCYGATGGSGNSATGGTGGTLLAHADYGGSGGGGGGGYFGGGGGSGGCGPAGSSVVGGGGGGGGGSSTAQMAGSFAQDTTGTPSVTLTPLAPAAPQTVRRAGASHIKVRRDGVITLKLAVPGRGSVNVLVTATRSRGARTTLTFARKRLHPRRARTLAVVLRPGRRDLRLLRSGGLGPLTLWITYKPRHGRSYTVVRRRLRVPRR